MANYTLTNVRLSYPNLFETAKFGGEDTGKYSASFLVPKGSKAEKVLMKMKEDIKEELKQKKLKIPEDKWFIKDGDETDDEYAQGHWIVRASNKNRPKLVDRDKNPVTKEDNEIEPMFFAGAYVQAVISFWIQDNKFGKRVNGNLAGIRFLKGDIEKDGFTELGLASDDDFDDSDIPEDDDAF